MTCSVPGCKNIRRLLHPDSDIGFHRLPRGKQFGKYMDILGKEIIKWKPTLLICSMHFKADDFIIKGGKRYLQQNALPTLHIDNDVYPNYHLKTDMLEAVSDPLNLACPNYSIDTMEYRSTSTICNRSPNTESAVNDSVSHFRQSTVQVQPFVVGRSSKFIEQR